MFNEFALKIDILIELLVSPTNLYAKQNERNFVTKKKRFSLGVSFIMAISQSPLLSLYWDSGLFIRNSGVQNFFTRVRFKSIIENLHLPDNIQSDKEEKGFKIQPVTDHLNESIRKNYSSDHMTKFKVALR